MNTVLDLESGKMLEKADMIYCVNRQKSLEASNLLNRI